MKRIKIPESERVAEVVRGWTKRGKIYAPGHKKEFWEEHHFTTELAEQMLQIQDNRP